MQGALPAIVDKGILAAAGSIGQVEAYHAAAIRVLLAQVADVRVPAYFATVGRLAGVR